jgi:hypothetical protein
MIKKYIVTLTNEERERLRKLTTTGKASASKLTRARILLKADRAGEHGGSTDSAIAAALDASHPTIERVRKRFVEEGFDVALPGKSTGRHNATKLDGEAEARLVALACSKPPDGHGRSVDVLRAVGGPAAR